MLTYNSLVIAVLSTKIVLSDRPNLRTTPRLTKYLTAHTFQGVPMETLVYPETDGLNMYREAVKENKKYNLHWMICYITSLMSCQRAATRSLHLHHILDELSASCYTIVTLTSHSILWATLTAVYEFYMLNVKYWSIFCDVISLLAQVFIVSVDTCFLWLSFCDMIVPSKSNVPSLWPWPLTYQSHFISVNW